MSLLSWVFPAKKRAKEAKIKASAPESSGLSRMESTRPAARGSREISASANAQPANRKQERMARREQLYAVVREAMVHAGILSSSYKFKVLSLDGRGRQFLVMADLSRDCSIAAPQLAEIEAMIAQAAKVRHGILVSAVYWRMSEHVAVGEPKAHAQSHRAAVPPQAEPSQPVPLDSEPASLERPSVATSRYEPLGMDEVAAFKRAMEASHSAPATPAAAGASAVAFDGKVHHGPQSYTLLTGFEDTEVAGGDARTPILSGTQYGELK